MKEIVRNNAFLLLFSFTLLVVPSCNKDERVALDRCKLSQSKRLTLKGNTRTGNNWYKIFQVKEIAGESFFIGYSYNRHQLEFWNLEEQAVEKILPLNTVGPDAVGEVNSFFYHNQDSIFFLNRFNLGIINQSGKVSLSKKINQDNSPIKGIDFSQKIIYVDLDHSGPIFYNGEENYLYFPIKRAGPPQSLEYYKDNNICARLNMETLTVEEIPIPYPLEFTKNFFGMLDKPNITFLKDRIVYNFKVSSKIYFFDKSTEEIKTYNFPTKFCSNLASAASAKSLQIQDIESLKEHVETNPRFFRVVYDEYNDMYYRPHYSPYLETRNRVGEIRQEYLMAIDGSLKNFTEMRVPPETNVMPMAASPEGLLLYERDDEEELVTFQIYRFDCPNEND